VIRKITRSRILYVTQEVGYQWSTTGTVPGIDVTHQGLGQAAIELY